MKVKEFKRLLERLPEPLRGKLSGELPRKFEVEVFQTDDFEIYLVEGKPKLLVHRREGMVAPTLKDEEAAKLLPRIIVDRGAIPHVCNGADVMKPGIIRVEGTFEVGSLIVVVDEEHGKPLAFGLSLHSSRDILSSKKGKMVKTIHYVGDKIWNIYKNL